MVDVSMRTPVPDDIDDLFINMRQADYEEVQAASGDVYRALVDSVRTSLLCWSVEIDGRLAAVFGVTPIDFTAGIGSPWMLGTQVLEAYPGHLTKQARRYLPQMLGIFPNLVNFVDARNVKSIRWLKALGFKFDDPVPYGVNGMPFHPFYMEAR